MIIVTIYKEATFVKFQGLQSTINPNYRSGDAKHKLDIDGIQGKLAVRGMQWVDWGARGL